MNIPVQVDLNVYDRLVAIILCKAHPITCELIHNHLFKIRVLYLEKNAMIFVEFICDICSLTLPNFFLSSALALSTTTVHVFFSNL